MDIAAERERISATKPKTGPARLWPRRATLLIAPLLPFLIFAPALFGRILIAPGDGYLYYLPIHKLTASAWLSGHLPSWNPFELSGAPLLASQAGAFYPLNAVFLFLSTVYANNIFILLNIGVGALGACLLARRLTGDDVGGLVAGLAFGSSGFLYGQIAHQPVLAGAVWMPWVLLGYDLLAERRSSARFLLTAGSLAMSALTGHAQMFFLNVLVLAAYALAIPALTGKASSERLKRFILLLSAVAVIEMLLPSTPWVLSFFMIFFALIIAATAGSVVRDLAGQRKEDHARPWLWLAPVAILLAGCLAAVQLLPTASVAGETIRSHLTVTTATSFSFSPSHLILLLFPYVFGNSSAVAPFDALYHGRWNLTELAGYTGLAAIVFAIAGISRIRRDPRALALGVAAVVALFIALGKSTGLGALVAFVPGYGQFRAWGRYAVVIDLTVAVFAGYGVAHLRSAAQTDRIRSRWRALTAFGALLAIGIVVPALPGVRQFVVGGQRHLLAIAFPLGAAALAVGCTFLFGRYDRLAVALCCILVAADGALSFGAFFEWRDSPSPAASRRLYSASEPPPWGPLPAVRGGMSRYFFAGSQSLAMLPYFPQVTDLKGIRSASGYDPLLGRRYADVVGGMTASGWIFRPEQFLRRQSWLLDVLRVSAVFVPERQAPRTTPAWFDSSSKSGQLVRYTYTPRLPAAFLIGRVQRVTSMKAVNAAKHGTSFDPRQSALVEGRCDACSAIATSGLAGSVPRVRWKANSIDLTVVATRPALMVVSESWFPGWSAKVDGRTAQVVRADSLVLGVPVPAGRHTVQLGYYPPGLTAGAAISGVTVAGFGFVPLLLFLRRRRRSPH